MQQNNRCDITKIKFNDEAIEDPVTIANIFNNYFSSIGDELARNIPPSNKQFVDFLGPSNDNSMFLVPTDRNEIIDIVSNLQNKKSSGFDGINNFILKKIILNIVDPLVHIFNLSLSNGQLPNTMKIAKVIPLFKCNGETYRRPRRHLGPRCFRPPVQENTAQTTQNSVQVTLLHYEFIYKVPTEDRKLTLHNDGSLLISLGWAVENYITLCFP